MNFKNKAAARHAMERTAVRTKKHGNFNKFSLPMPIVVLTRLGLKPKRENYGGYWVLRCPFHKAGQEINPSLNLHQVDGHFRCHACGIRGGDILDFYMKFTGKGFIDAACDLGAWEDRR
jgi:DNA primase